MSAGAPVPPRDHKPRGPNPLALAGAGLELGLVIAAMTLGGWWLDQKMGTRPWLMVIGLAVALIGGTYNVYRQGKRYFE